MAAYVGEGNNCWPAAHVLDVAKLYGRVLDKGQQGARYHAVAEEGIASRQIAEVVAKELGIAAVSITPEEAQPHFGWFAMFAGMDLRASGRWTQQQMGWRPTGAGLIEDLSRMKY